MNDTLKAAGRIGAELGAAKAEVERLRETLKTCAAWFTKHSPTAPLIGGFGDAEHPMITFITAALSQQADPLAVDCSEMNSALEPIKRALLAMVDTSPTDTYTAVDMATAAAQGFRDGQAAVEQAAAQDEAELSAEEILMLFERNGFHIEAGASYSAKGQIAQLLNAAGELLRRNDTRPAQTEQQPEQMNISPLLNAGAALSNIAFNLAQRHGVTLDQIACDTLSSARKSWDSARAALNFQQGKFRMGDLVKKSTGSEWEGRVVGWYSTEQTPEGYAVESSAHRNSVQIYPAKALEAVE